MHSRCEARSHHCHAAISRHVKSRQVTEAATRKLTIACGLCLIFIAGEVSYTIADLIDLEPQNLCVKYDTNYVLQCIAH